jgi:hypothetical protein
VKKPERTAHPVCGETALKMPKGVSAMVTIAFTREETEAMQETLESYLSDLRFEIEDTKQKAFREELKKKEAFLKGVLGHLSLIGMEEFDRRATESTAD